MKKLEKTHMELEMISRKAMRSQLASHRIEGINIEKKDAEKIRQEVLQEFKTFKPNP